MANFVKCIYCNTHTDFELAQFCQGCGAPLNPVLNRPLSLVGRAKEAFYSLATAEWQVVGVDISEWQGVVDFDRLATRAQFVIMRAGYGNSYVDAKLDYNRRACMDRNIPFGLYWYLKPDRDFRKHARSFYDAWVDAPGVIPPDFDFEESGNLGKTALEGWHLKCVNEFKSLAGLDLLELMEYTSPGFLNANFPQTNWMKWMHLHVAHWTNALAPILPIEWIKINNPRTWTFWQYAVADADGYGVQSTKIDLDRYNGSVEDFNRQFGTAIEPLPGTEPPVEPPPEPEPVSRKVKVKATALPFLNYRQTPGGTDLGDLMPGTVVTVDGQDGEWLHMSGGWVHQDWVDEVG